MFSSFSHTILEFQLLHNPAAFNAERIAWRAVIYLNLIRSIRRILNALLPLSSPPSIDPSSTTIAYQSVVQAHQDDVYQDGYDTTMSSGHQEETNAPQEFDSLLPFSNYNSLGQMARFEKYAERLAPLMALEQSLMKQLSFPEEDDDLTSPTYVEAPFSAASTSSAGQTQTRSWNVPQVPTPIQMQPTHLRLPTTASSSYHSSATSPISLGASGSVSTLSVSKSGELAQSLQKFISFGESTSSRIGNRKPKVTHIGEISGWWEDPDDPVHVLNACARGDWGMVSMWKDRDVRSVLARKKVLMEESSGL